MRAFTTLFLLAFCALAPAAEPARPAETLFAVEIVFFRTLNPLGGPEDWSVESADTDTPAAADGTLTVRALSPADFRLAGTDAALARNANYRVLGHVGWVQAAAPRGASLTVDLKELGLKDPALRGRATLEQGKYLYLGLDAAYSPADPPASLMGSAAGGHQPVTFALKQKRRVKSSERHYFDHPAFGAIAIVTAIK